MRPIPATRLGDAHGLIRAIEQRGRLRTDEFVTEFQLEELFPPDLENAVGRMRHFISYARAAGLVKEDRGVVELTDLGRRYVRAADPDAFYDVSSQQAEWLRRQLREKHMTDSIFHGLAIGLSLLASTPPGSQVATLDFGRSMAYLGRAGWDNENTLQIQGERHVALLRDMELIDEDRRLTPTGEQLRSELTLPIHMSLLDIAVQLNPGGADAVSAAASAEFGGEPEPAPAPSVSEATPPAESEAEDDNGYLTAAGMGAVSPPIVPRASEPDTPTEISPAPPPASTPPPQAPALAPAAQSEAVGPAGAAASIPAGQPAPPDAGSSVPPPVGAPAPAAQPAPSGAGASADVAAPDGEPAPPESAASADAPPPAPAGAPASQEAATPADAAAPAAAQPGAVAPVDVAAPAAAEAGSSVPPPAAAAVPRVAPERLGGGGFVDARAIRAAAEEAGLQLPAGVYANVAAALGSGRHLLLTGAPGSGKTTLALAVARAAAQAGRAQGATVMMAGGEAAAAVGERVVEAARRGRWLVLDELDRAEPDAILGPLSTFLGGLPVALAGKEVAPAADWRLVATWSGPLPREPILRRFAAVEVATLAADNLRVALRTAAGGDATAAAAAERLLPLAEAAPVGIGVFLAAARHAAERNAVSPTDEATLAREAYAAYVAPLLGDAGDGRLRELLGDADR